MAFALTYVTPLNVTPVETSRPIIKRCYRILLSNAGPLLAGCRQTHLLKYKLSIRFGLRRDNVLRIVPHALRSQDTDHATRHCHFPTKKRHWCLKRIKIDEEYEMQRTMRVKEL